MVKLSYFAVISGLIALYLHLACFSSASGRFMPGGKRFGQLKATVSTSRSPPCQQSRTPRNGSPSIGTVRQTISSLLTIPQLYHIPIPRVPIFNAMGFEILFFAYLVSALGLQYLNIYKLNFHVVDVHLVTFILIFLSRRLIWNILKQTLASEILFTVKYFLGLIFKAVIFLVVICTLTWLLWKLFQHNSIQNCLFLLYPIVMYLCAFGFTLDPQGNKVMFKISPHVEISQIHLIPTRTMEKKAFQNGDARQELIGKPNCTLPPDAVRYEAECLRTDFNSRIKQVLFQSLLCAYFVGFLPMRFSEQHHVYYDLWWACQQILFIWLSSLLVLMMYMLPLTYCDALHKCAVHLGGWERYTCGHRETPHVWSPLTVWPQGVLVRHNKLLYKGLGIHNVAIPGDPHHSRFFFMFESPLRLINWMSASLLALVLYQLVLIIRCHFWYQLLSVVGMLSFNYVILYRILRDRWALQGVLAQKETRD
ncbi:transmembrane protein 39A-A isoform X2 [Nematostella vectensis]|uniref:transmembrane protein 39A-A isoform X1 n=1 Tax=Nematostella vectensis TaxID=45351 RepID=UPI002077351D|nr:transmembrane protein 39A-A isoform X1 [Nematostella vectensis]XP_032239221.2 transmembrane protein 39A-A isoform X2 [Nematostella vectensis]